MSTSPARRRLLAASAGGGLIIGLHLPFSSALARMTGAGSDAAASGDAVGATLAQATRRPAAAGPEVNAWVVVRPDDTVVIRIARSEMGQGTLTGLAQLVAEELDCDWARVTTEYPTPGENLARQRVWQNFSTGGSRGIRESHQYVREGGAAARQMLVRAAADRWQVPAGECSAAASVITHGASGRTLRYGEVAEAASRLDLPQKVALKDPKDWKIAGRRLPRLDTVDKVNGEKVYGMDLVLPGMVNAAIKACPVFGGRLKSFDRASIAGRPGVHDVMAVGDTAVAVLADTWWHAKTALDALTVVWDEGDNAKIQQADIDAMLKAGLEGGESRAVTDSGEVAAALAKAARRHVAVYAYPFQHHATMETMNATALVTADRCEVWTPTQNGEAALVVAAEAAGLPASKCDVYKIDLGGGFGRRGAAHDWVRQAVTIAKAHPGTPVKLIWSREEDMAHGLYHPITQCRLEAGLDADGKVEALHMRISGQSILAGLLPQNIKDGMDPVVFQGLNPGGAEAAIGYSFPSVKIEHAMRNPHVPPGFWRGVNLNQNAIYLECFLDELAHETGQDPLAFRRQLMQKHPKHLAVLDAVAKAVGWDQPAPKGIHRGLSQTMGFGSYVAACAEVSVDDDGRLKIHRIVAATDPGHAVNPQQIEAQVEGSFVYGLSAALYGHCTVKDGRIEQSNFHDYPPMLLAQMPAVETLIVPTGGFWGGVGEPTIAVAAPAVLNAIFAATGKRIRTLPLKDQSLKRA